VKSGDEIVLRLGRYALFGEIASGGMAAIHYGRLAGTGGFQKTIAIKRLLPQFARDPDFRSMIEDEARLCARIRHPNVVTPLDVLSTDHEVLLAMEYVHGESLSRLLKTARQKGKAVPPAVAASILSGMLHGLHAAHEATDEHGRPLGIVHRDVSPHNVMVGVDGIARVIDFGIAKASTSRDLTQTGQVKGKLPYISPEIYEGAPVTRAADVYAAAVVMWETLTGRRLFEAETDEALIALVLRAPIDPPSDWSDGVPKSIDQLVLAGLARDPAGRPRTCKEMALALEQGMPLAPPSAVGAWVEELAQPNLAQRAALLARVERVAVTIDDRPSFVSLDPPPRSRPEPPPPRSRPEPPPPSLAPQSRTREEPLRPPPAGALRKPEVEIPNVAWMPTPAQYADVVTEKPRRISGGVFVVAIVLIALAALLVALPSVIRRQIVRDAAKSGIVLEVEDVALSPRRIRLTGVKATSAEMPFVKARASAVDVALKELSPEGVRVRGLELTVDGAIADRVAEVKKARARAADPKASADDGRREIPLVVEPARVTWIDPLGRGTKILAENVTAEAKIDARAPFAGPPVQIAAPLTRFEAAGAIAGPWKVDVVHGGITMKVTARLDVTGALDARLSLALTEEGSWLLEWDVPRARARDLGLPRLPADAPVEGRGRVLVRERGESAGQGALVLDAARLDLTFAGASPEALSVSGALGAPADKIGAFGTVSVTDRGVRVDVTAQCDEKRGGATLVALGFDSKDLARAKLEIAPAPLRCSKR